jgi:hypothetical protein
LRHNAQNIFGTNLSKRPGKKLQNCETRKTEMAQPQTPPGFSLFLEGVYLLTAGGYYLLAAGGGGDISDSAIQTQFKYVFDSGTTTPDPLGAFELFNVFKEPTANIFAFQTVNGNFITAVDGGGRTTDVLHTDAVSVGAWEQFRIAQTGPSGAFSVSIQTHSNNFLTAVGLGGKTTDAIHSDATKVGSWETFFIRQWGSPGDVSPAASQYFIVDISKNQAIAARGGGGQTQNTIQFAGINGNTPLDWARFTLIPQSNGSYALQTINENYVTAVNGGGLDYGTESSDNIHTDATIASTWEQFRFASPFDDGSFAIQTFKGYYLGKRTFGGAAEGEYSTDITDLDAASRFWLIPAAFF